MAAFDDGYFRTGDLAVRAQDGYYTLQGRRSDLIISGGFNIYPREIEEFLEEQASVAEAAVVGVPDKLRGEVPVAYVVPRGTPTRGIGGRVPRLTGQLQGPARVHRCRQTAAHRPGQNPEASSAQGKTVMQRMSAWRAVGSRHKSAGDLR